MLLNSMPYLRQWFWLLPDLHAAHVDEGLRQESRVVHDHVGVDQRSVEVREHVPAPGSAWHVPA